MTTDPSRTLRKQPAINDVHKLSNQQLQIILQAILFIKFLNLNRKTHLWLEVKDH